MKRFLELFDTGSLRLVPPRHQSRWLGEFGLQAQIGDGVVLGSATLDDRRVLFAAQDSRFMGGTLGEVHCAYLSGMLQAALEQRPAAVLLFLDSAGARLQEGTLAMIGLRDIVSKIFALRTQRIPVCAFIGDSLGAFGGTAYLAGCCERVLAFENSSFALCGPRVLSAFSSPATVQADAERLRKVVQPAHRRATSEVHDVLLNDRASARTVLCEALSRPGDLGFDALVQRQDLMHERCMAGSLHASPAPAATVLPEVGEPGTSLRALLGCDVMVSGRTGAVAGWLTLDGIRTAVLGHAGTHCAGAPECLRLAGDLLDVVRERPGCPILIIANTVQAFSLRNEELGFAAILGHLAAVVALAEQRGHRVLGLIPDAGCGAALMAAGMSAREVYMLPGAKAYSLPPSALQTFIGRHPRLPLSMSAEARVFSDFGDVVMVRSPLHGLPASDALGSARDGLASRVGDEVAAALGRQAT